MPGAVIRTVNKDRVINRYFGIGGGTHPPSHCVGGHMGGGTRVQWRGGRRLAEFIWSKIGKFGKVSSFCQVRLLNLASLGQAY